MTIIDGELGFARLPVLVLLDMHKCLCSTQCDAVVTTEGKLYARGHSPASHSEERNEKSRKEIQRLCDAGEIKRLYGDDNVSRRPDVRRKISRALKGVSKSEEHSAKISTFMKENYRPENLIGTMLGKQHSKKTKLQMSQSAKEVRKRKTWSGIPKGTKLNRHPWNKGLTRKTDKRVAAYSKKLIGHPIYAWGKYPYRGYIMRCTWEVAYAMYLDKLGLEWTYEPRWFRVGRGPWNGVTYRPDFQVPALKTYVEIKGAWLNGSKAKVAKFRKLYPKINLLVLTELELMEMGILNAKGDVPFPVERLA